MSSHKTLHAMRCVALGALTALTFGVAAHAEEATTAAEPQQTVIRYSDLDLSRDADVRTLYTRLQRASSQVCGQYRESRDLSVKLLYKACYQDTLARAVKSVDHAAVTAMFAADDRIRMAGHGSKAQSSI